MQLAPPFKVSCPHCGEVKELVNLYSGNTFGSTSWSDTKTTYPMLPQRSPVQRCLHCGKYFFLEDAEELKPDEDEWGVEVEKEERQKKFRTVLGKIISKTHENW